MFKYRLLVRKFKHDLKRNGLEAVLKKLEEERQTSDLDMAVVILSAFRDGAEKVLLPSEVDDAYSRAIYAVYAMPKRV